ncbi:MAG: Bax inhibitor-1/YccA family protein [Endomicrobium sp.]|nr:Bax inhibitor-1/YccA family protein [Endomicrobium sp.]
MSNPLLKNSFFQSPAKGNEVMTVPGTINKSMILWFFLAISAFYSWMHPDKLMSLMFPILIVAFILAIVLVFKQIFSPFLSPLYAICEGLVLGFISLSFERVYPGVVVNAIFLTICVLFCMLAAYKTGILKATPRFQKVIIIATFAIAFVYVIDLFFNFFGVRGFSYIHNSSGLGIIINLSIVTVASLNLIIDFDLIERNAQHGAPKYMEWYSAFSLMVTLVWIYLEILRFLTKLRD